MLRFLSRWRPGHLLAVWSAYWLGLAAAVVTPVLLAIHRASLTGAAPGTTDLSLSLSDKAGFTVTITQAGRAWFEASVAPLSATLAIAIPPLVLWTAWLYARTRARALPDGEAGNHPAELAQPMPDLQPAERRESVSR